MSLNSLNLELLAITMSRKRPCSASPDFPEYWKKAQYIRQLEFEEILQIIIANDSEKLKRVIENDQVYDINMTIGSYAEETLLTEACERGSSECVKVLLDNGADFHTRNLEGFDPFTAACYSGHIALIKLLIKESTFIDDDLLLRCFGSSEIMSKTEVVAILLEQIVDVDTDDKDYSNFLYCACKVGNVSVATNLLERGANRDAVNSKGSDSLCVAAERGHIHIIKLLINWNRETLPIPQSSVNKALIGAASAGHTEVLRILTELGSTDKNTLTLALHAALEWTDIEPIEYLLSIGADVNAGDRVNHPPLHRVFYSRPRHCRYTLYDSTRGVNNPELLTLVLKHGANINHADQYGYTALSRSILARDMVAIHILMEYGADLDVVYTNGSNLLLTSIEHN